MMVENSDGFEVVSKAKEIPFSPANESASIPAASTTDTDTHKLSNPTVLIRNFTLNNPEFQQITTNTAAKIDSLKKWTVNTYKNTKHGLLEHMGKIEKTVDKELEDRIENLRELRKSYRELLSTAQYYTQYIVLANNMQRSMANAFCELAGKETNIARELNLQSELLGLITQNNEPFQRNLTLFLSSLQTLTDSTIEDTFLTIESHDQARLEFAISRQELQAAREAPNMTAETITVFEEKYNKNKQKYEQLKEDVLAKLVLLEENRCKVMRKQIVALQMAYKTNLSATIQLVERASEDLAKMGLASANQDSLPASLVAKSGFHSFLEK